MSEIIKPKIITPNEYVTKHFMYSEFKCPCCERIKLIPAFFAHVGKLETMRRDLGFPIVIMSGYRCKKHNEEVHGSPESWHMLFATDIRPESFDPHELLLMYHKAEQLKFMGIGLYEDRNFIHVDLRPEKARWRV